MAPAIRKRDVQVLAGQMLLPGVEAMPSNTDRLFFAVFPDAATALRIADLSAKLRVM